jgi:hypothetical protein
MVTPLKILKAVQLVSAVVTIGAVLIYTAISDVLGVAVGGGGLVMLIVVTVLLRFKSGEP